MFYLLAFMLGGVMGVIAIALTSAGGEQEAYLEGYREGTEDARARHLSEMERMLNVREEKQR